MRACDSSVRIARVETRPPTAAALSVYRVQPRIAVRLTPQPDTRASNRTRRHVRRPTRKEAEMSEDQLVGAVDDLPPGRVTGIGRYAVGNAGGETVSRSAVDAAISAPISATAASMSADTWSAPGTRRPTTSALVEWCAGRRGCSRRIPGLDWAYRTLTRVLPFASGPGGRARRPPLRALRALGRSPFRRACSRTIPSRGARRRPIPSESRS